MYKIANRVIFFSNKTKIEKKETNLIKIKGEKGEINLFFPGESLDIIIGNNNSLTTVSRKNIILTGTYNSILKNAIEGVEKGFEKVLKIIGRGYKVLRKEEKLEFNLGKSHTDLIEIPKDLKIEVLGIDTVTIKGVDKQRVNFFAQEIKKLRLPNPYKKKGIYYSDEKVKLKERKKT